MKDTRRVVTRELNQAARNVRTINNVNMRIKALRKKFARKVIKK